MLAEFTSVFPCRLDSAVKRPGTTNWKPVSRFHYLLDKEITDSIQPTAKLLRAVSFDTTTRFLVIAIPAASPYYCAASLAQIRHTLQRLNINTAPYEFENSWYLYIYFSRPVQTHESAKILKDCLYASGYETGTDTLQVFPCNVPLPLPLQSGFTWLDDHARVLRRRDDLPLRTALELFLSDISKCETDHQILHQFHLPPQTLPLLSRHHDNSTNVADPGEQRDVLSNQLESIQPEPLAKAVYASLTLEPGPETFESAVAPLNPAATLLMIESELISREPPLELFEFGPPPIDPDLVLLSPAPDLSEKQNEVKIQDVALDIHFLASACEPEVWRLLSESLELDLDRTAAIAAASAELEDPVYHQTPDTTEQIQYVALLGQKAKTLHIQEPELFGADSAPLQPVPELLQPDQAPLKPEPKLRGTIPEPLQPEPVSPKRLSRERKPTTASRNRHSVPGSEPPRPDSDPGSTSLLATRKSAYSRSRAPCKTSSKPHFTPQLQEQSYSQPETDVDRRPTTNIESKTARIDPDTQFAARLGTRRVLNEIQLVLFPDLLTCERAPPDTG
jgi:hypothetical protein